MLTLDLKPTHKAIKDFYQDTEKLLTEGHVDEGKVAPLFGILLRHCANQVKWQLIEQKRIAKGVIPDGVFYDELNLPRGFWEAKDTKDDLAIEINKKFARNYPKDNILFQSPHRIVIYQGRDTPVFDAHIKDNPQQLIAGLKLFFEYQKPAVADWLAVTEEFKGKIPDLGQQLVGILETANKTNKAYQKAFERFTQLCLTDINPNLKTEAIEEMLIQHLLTERIFTTVFDNPDFVENNVIAKEINQVIKALTSQSFNKAEFIKSNQLDRFYVALERVAATIDDYVEKQPFLNAVYERFFQGFAVKVADTHGIVYTPQPIVDFMVKSVEEILQQEFKRSLADNDVHIIDPFVGTGNFIIRILKEISTLNPFQLEQKYLHELHCNEVMLLPYYIASMNIEHTFYEITKKYQPFEGICLVDTFDAFGKFQQSHFFVPENTQRVLKQANTPIFVIIGNPPYYNVVHENDNNRPHKILNEMIRETYAKASKATNKNTLSNAYVKAFKWATWRLEGRDEGVVAFVTATDKGFLDDTALDGMRKYLAQDFKTIYILDLGGNVRKNPKTHNVFGIQSGVSINFLVKNSKGDRGIFYAHIGDSLSKKEKLDYLAENSFATVNWNQFYTFIPSERADSQIVIYTSNDKKQFDVPLRNETIWLSQAEMATLFEKDSDTIGFHLKNIYREGELDALTTTEYSSVVRQEGRRRVERKITVYNLDAIISVGYRVNSKKGTDFRIWATNILKKYLVQGYALNEKKLQEQQEKTAKLKEGLDVLERMNALSYRVISTLAPSDEIQGIFSILEKYSHTLAILDDYDHKRLQIKDTLNQSVDCRAITYDEAMQEIRRWRERDNLGDLFGKEKDNSFKSSLETIYQTYDGEELYPSIEEKAANLLYFIIKNHSFIDGNKRIAAVIFAWFLECCDYLYNSEGEKRIADNALVAFTLLIAESNPKEKESIVKVIINLINSKN